VKKLEQIQVKHEIKERKQKKQALIEDVLNRIREIESRDDRTDPDAIKPFQQVKERLLNKEQDKVSEKAKTNKAKNDSEFYRINYGHEDLKRFEEDAGEAKHKIAGLTELVAKKKPNLNKEEQLAIVEELYELNSSSEKYKIRDEIAALRILLDNEKYKIKANEADADSAYTADLIAQIAELASLL